jgi:beta-lactamase regulating signal transducer with metallopeptidase domain
MSITGFLLGLDGLAQVEWVLELLLRSTLVVAGCLLMQRSIGAGVDRLRTRVWTAGFALLIALPLLPALPSLFHVVFDPPVSTALLDNPSYLAGARAGAADWLRLAGANIPNELVTADPSVAGPGVFAWLAAAWLLVAASQLVHLCTGYVIVRRIIRTAPPPPAAMLHRILAAVPAAAEVRIRIVARAVPFSFGWRRPVIVLPPEAADWTDDVLRSVLGHELAHVRRRDWPRQMAGRVASALLWFNPLVRYAANRCRMQAELECDRAALVVGVSARAYAEAIMHVLTHAGGRQELATTLSFASGKEVEQRLRALPRGGVERVQSGHVRFALVASGILLLIAGSAAGVGLGPCEGVAPVRVEMTR